MNEVEQYREVSQHNTKIQTVIIRDDLATNFTIDGANVLLDYRIDDVVGFKVRYISLRLPGATALSPIDGSIILLHSSLAGDIMGSTYRVSRGVDTTSLKGNLDNTIIGWSYLQNLFNSEGQSDANTNRYHEFSSKKSVQQFSFYLSGSDNLPLTHPTTYTIEVIIDFYTTCY